MDNVKLDTNELYKAWYKGLGDYIELAKSMGIDKNDLVEIFKKCMEASAYKTHKQD